MHTMWTEDPDIASCFVLFFTKILRKKDSDADITISFPLAKYPIRIHMESIYLRGVRLCKIYHHNVLQIYLL